VQYGSITVQTIRVLKFGAVTPADGVCLSQRLRARDGLTFFQSAARPVPRGCRATRLCRTVRGGSAAGPAAGRVGCIEELASALRPAVIEMRLKDSVCSFNKTKISGIRRQLASAKEIATDLINNFHDLDEVS